MRLPLLLALLSLSAMSPAVELAYPKTDPAVCEVKDLPASRLMVARSEAGYFSGNNRMFGKLFRYIQSNRIPMTAPVEARIQPGVMIFHCDVASAAREDLRPTPEVTLEQAPARTVAAIGIRGSYTEKAYRDNLARLRAWLATQPGVIEAGEPYAVYWDSPFVPGFLKRSEVHIPVRRTAR
jgi:hypothetical protein